VRPDRRKGLEETPGSPCDSPRRAHSKPFPRPVRIPVSNIYCFIYTHMLSSTVFAVAIMKARLRAPLFRRRTNPINHRLSALERSFPSTLPEDVANAISKPHGINTCKIVRRDSRRTLDLKLSGMSTYAISRRNSTVISTSRKRGWGLGAIVLQWSGFRTPPEGIFYPRTR
jgi:hypothetical protein